MIQQRVWKPKTHPLGHPGVLSFSRRQRAATWATKTPQSWVASSCAARSMTAKWLLLPLSDYRPRKGNSFQLQPSLHLFPIAAGCISRGCYFSPWFQGKGDLCVFSLLSLARETTVFLACLERLSLTAQAWKDPNTTHAPILPGSFQII